MLARRLEQHPMKDSRERERQRERERDKERERERGGERETEREKKRDRERDREREKERQRQRERATFVFHSAVTVINELKVTGRVGLARSPAKTPTEQHWDCKSSAISLYDPSRGLKTIEEVILGSSVPYLLLKPRGYQFRRQGGCGGWEGSVGAVLLPWRTVQ